MYLSMATRKAQSTPCKYKVAAVGYDREGNYVATTTNRPRFSRFGGSIHAEVEMMRRYSQVTHILLFRTNNSGHLIPIDPCENCAAIAEKKGVQIICLNDRLWSKFKLEI